MNDAYSNQSVDMHNLMGDLGVDAEIDRELNAWPKNEHGDYICCKEKPMQKWMVAETKGKARWEHDDVRETDYDSDYTIEYKCHSCGHTWRTEMPD